MEKYGVVPVVTIEGALDSRVYAAPGHIRFVAAELLKNATFATIKKFGSDADLDAPPIVVTVSADNDDGTIGFRVADGW